MKHSTNPRTPRIVAVAISVLITALIALDVASKDIPAPLVFAVGGVVLAVLLHITAELADRLAKPHP